MSRPLRILFDLVYPGYLRYFDSAIAELSARGHRVEVWFDHTGKQPEGLEALAGLANVVVGGAMPRREPEHVRRSRVHRALADFVRYLDPRFADAQYLRNRARAQLPFVLRPLGRLRTAPAGVVARVVRRLLALERAMPPSEAVTAFLRERQPDVVVVAPYVFFRGEQADVGAAARSLGIPTVATIASWDNLTTKGLLRGSPELVTVWNEAQAEEAIELHGVPRERIAVTGAQPFDKWFGRAPAEDAATFAERVGLPGSAGYLLFVGSTASISAPYAEQRFVRAWLGALRASRHPRLREIGVMIRPHPFNTEHWDEADVSELPGVVVWPRGGANPVNESDRNDYFDSIHHCAAVVGINTSAMLEAAIVGRPVLSVASDEFSDTQRGTLHFRHLLPENGGFLQVAETMDEHLAQLAATLDDPERVARLNAEFVARFVRPLGIDRPATPIFADAVEAAAGALVPAAPPPHATPLLHALSAIDAIDRAVDPRGSARRLRRRAKRDRARADRALRGLERLGGAVRVAPLARIVSALGRAVDRAAAAWQRALLRLASRLAGAAADGGD